MQSEASQSTELQQSTVLLKEGRIRPLSEILSHLIDQFTYSSQYHYELAGHVGEQLKQVFVQHPSIQSSFWDNKTDRLKWAGKILGGYIRDRTNSVIILSSPEALFYSKDLDGPMSTYSLSVVGDKIRYFPSARGGPFYTTIKDSNHLRKIGLSIAGPKFKKLSEQENRFEIKLDG